MLNLDLDILMVLVPALPLAAALLIAFTGKWLLKQNSHLPAVLAIGCSFLVSLLVLNKVYERTHHEPAGTAEIATADSHAGEHAARPGWEHTYTIWTWAKVDNQLPVSDLPEASGVDPGAVAAWLPLNLGVTLRADTLTAMMLSMVTFISTLVVIYAASYMHGDEGYWRFFAYVSLFVFSMTMLVSASNFMLLYVFWEAVGVCSYLLIGFWFTKPEAAAAAKKAFLVNRIGDFGFALGIFLIWVTYGTLNFHDTSGMPGVIGETRLSLGAFVGGGVGLAIALLLFVGACGKSAQFPLHVWLPDAMEGPTPVSALIHAATMVTAGVYMVARCMPLFLAGSIDLGCCTLTAGEVVAGIGGVTALLAGLIALTQHDLKRVMAYSTVSQLGYMFLALGTGTLAGVVAALFHLFTHAFFKALLFLGSGSVMHAMGGVIDMRRYGGLRRIMPITHWTFLIGCLALAGVFPLAGFWSKDTILGALSHRAEHSTYFQVLFYVATVSAFLTAFYTFRAFFRTFYGETVVPPEAGHHAHESPQPMAIPLMVLAVCAVVVGWYFESHHRFANWLEAAPQLAYANTSDLRGPLGVFDTQIAIVSSIVALLGIGIAAYLYLGDRTELRWLEQRPWLKPWHALSYGRFYIDGIYYVTIVLPMRALAAVLYAIDRWLVDGAVNLVGALPPLAGSWFRSLQSGMVQFYALAMILGLLVLIGSLLM